MTISEKILKLRKEKGLSQEALAEKLGVSRQSVSKWETSGVLPDIDNIVAMSELFGVSTDFLLKNDEGEPVEESLLPEDASDEEIIPSDEIDNTLTADDETEYVPAQNIEPPKSKKRKKIKLGLIITAIILVVATFAASVCIPTYHGGIKELWWQLNGGKLDYPYVLVHGLGGWGEGNSINDVAQYWGGGTFDLKKVLEANGNTVYTPSVGPFSSTWDRACELYAQLTGTRVDYGEAHSKEHNHSRYGRTYTEPLVENWGERSNGGQRIKINLIGHSFGGATVRLLASLLENGNDAEKQVTKNDISPLFEGGKGDYVYSVTTLCAPHNGSSLTEIINGLGSTLGISDTTDLLMSLCFSFSGIADPVAGVYDFQLDHFGINSTDPEKAVDALTQAGTDHAAYDLSPDGAAKLNETIETVDDVYYFSYAYSTTEKSKIFGTQTPDSSTLKILYPVAVAMGSYSGTTSGGIVIDSSWQENDGLVNVVSARYPFGEEFVSLSEKPEEIRKGIWNVAETRRGDHGKVIGLNAEADPTLQFYTNLFMMIDKLER